jgi:hypothetical protein
MPDEFELPKIVENPITRRLWLLWKALECAPLDRAIELARAADAFVVADSAGLSASDVRSTTQSSAKTKEVEPASDLALEPVAPVAPAAPQRAGLSLSPERREQLLNRLVEGATNAQVGHEFGLALRQVQGMRMGAAREIVKRRDGRVVEPAAANQAGTVHASAEEIVRYLRQQDDVVVPQDDGHYLVNGRFRLGLSELVSKANRMRQRQGRPTFNLANGHASPVVPPGSASRHPIFWAKPSSAIPEPSPV